MSKITKIIAVCGIAAMLGTSVMAIPLPPLAGTPVAGQSDLTSFVNGPVGPGGLITIDWMVIDAGNLNPQYKGAFAYLYQVEVWEDNPTHVDAFNVTFNTQGTIDSGYIVNDDLDVNTTHPEHDAGTFGNLAGEVEGFSLQSLTVNTSLDPDGITWSLLGGIDAGWESETLFFIHPNPPVYGNAVAQNSTPPSPWGSLAERGQSVPVPGRSVPDSGATMMLLGLAVTGLGLVGRGKKSA